MAASILKALFFTLLLSLTSVSQAATVTYDWNITWVRANPDGQHERPTIGINGQWPLPHLTATVGDQVVINVDNQLGNQSTSLHFHGLYMNGSTHMDGAAGVSQCAIPPGTTFKYNFTIDQPGTYWYHSHENGQYPDGLRGPLIVHDLEFPHQYDEEIILTLSDWYHDQMPGLIKTFISFANPTGAEPVPNSALMNDTQNLTVAVEPGKTYLVRMVNMGAFAGQYVWFENHTMQTIEVDGIYTEPAEADMIYITAAQRYSVLLTTKNDTGSNFAFVASMDKALFDTVPENLNPNVTGWLVYDETKDLPKPTLLDSFDPFDDFTLVPTDGEKLYENVDHSITLDLKMGNLGDGANYAFFNDITYVRPKVPTLYSALSTGVSASNASVYGVNSNAFILKKNEVVEIVLNNNDPGRHPFHLHGHSFQTIVRSAEDAGNFVDNETFPTVPMKRDTVLVRPNGYLVLRFRADNPDKFLPPSLPLTLS
ncbi:multicopper oxidase [Lasallia pustulata]|uniref:Multicopper oxidase n=1 Tax=Lasallia pustulata TaxID=136370 RepID=A0A1W5DDZ6_9LECA|nr:multicopper oxidase [Lasallia pustulata]